LTLVRTPGTRGGYADQGTQDIGRHEIRFGIAGHAAIGAKTELTGRHIASISLCRVSESVASRRSVKSLSLLRLNNDRVRVLALKKAELTDEVIVRLVETDGVAADNVHLTFMSPVVARA
jgi:alpha-mannosidase